MDDTLYIWRNAILLKILNEMPLEFLVYRLLKVSKTYMSAREIMDELFFVIEVDRGKLNLILNYYDFIHCDNGKYYYCKKGKSIENYILNIMNKIKYIEQMDFCELVHNLLAKTGRPMELSEITDALNSIVYINEKELERKLKDNDEFKIIGHKMYALSSWEEYKAFNYDLKNDILKFKKLFKISDRDWEIFKKYIIYDENLTLQDIGEEYNLTRERVRQIVKKVNDKINQPDSRNIFSKYIFLVNSFIDDYGVLCLNCRRDRIKLEEYFYNIKPVEIINFLNIYGDKFVVFDDKYIWKKEKYDKLVNYLNYMNDKISTKFLIFEDIDTIYNELNIKGWREKELVKLLIDKDKRTYIDENKNLCYFSKENFSRYHVLYIILQEFGEPIHYSIVMEKYIEITKEKTNLRLIHSYLDRRKDLFVRIFTGIYGLKEWGYDEHVFVIDLVVKLLDEKKCVMHYKDIYDLIKDKTLAKKKTMYNLMQTDDRIVSLGSGYYGLAAQIKNSNGDIKYYSNIIDKNNDRRLGYLLGKYTNEYNNVIVVYRVTETILNSYSIKVPEVLGLDLDRDIYMFDMNYNRYPCGFDNGVNNLYGLNNFLNRNEIDEGEILVLEFIASNIIRIFTKEEYENKYEVFDDKRYEEYADVPNEIYDEDDFIEVRDVNSLLNFGLKHGFIYYEDLNEIDVTEKYDDVFELMVDFEERGIVFLNKD